VGSTVPASGSHVARTMADNPHFCAVSFWNAGAVSRELSLPLFWRVCLTNGAVFFLGTLVLVLSPATVSARPLGSEVVVLSIGLAVIVLLNALLLRSALRPLDRLTALMATFDPRQPGRRLDERGSGPARPLVLGFNAMLERLETERSESTAGALHAQEAERQRIAQELHDEVGQTLTAIVLRLDRLARQASPELKGELEGTREDARASLEDVRRIAQRLRPETLEDLGLSDSLQALCDRVADHADIRVVTSLNGGGSTLPPQAELVIFRVAQEALTNVLRHAEAAHVRVELRHVAKELVLRVVDDGVGVHPEAVGGGGLQGMRERALLVGGRVSIAAVNPGTEVTLRVPIEEAE